MFVGSVWEHILRGFCFVCHCPTDGSCEDVTQGRPPGMRSRTEPGNRGFILR
ncbi:Uncharacterized protein dnm_029060 [Desulfonema magnum]|uniref:Uncharacterized protein n=1 Tax=Desulfonema magnum TaxID=45655 RepID=A0A975BK05_9BACT|nr:Uncharacterized protein dnm_029060 [Desulfonema magnum]